MYHKKSEKGQALVIIALAAVGLFAFTALAVDGTRVFSDRRHAQNAADTAVLAAALAKIRTPDYPPYAPNAPDLAAIAAGEERAESNGYVTDVTDADPTVEVRFCDEVLALGLTPPCEGVPVGADLSEYIQVVIKLTTKTTFARIIGRLEVPSIVTAVARAKPGSFSPLIEDMALAAMNLHDPDAMFGHGNIFLDVNGGGVFVNSDYTSGCPPGSGAMTTDGNGTYDAPVFEVVGSLCSNGTSNIVGTQQSGSQIPPLVNVDPPTFTCDPGGGLVGTTFTPGTYGHIDIPGGTYTFENGNYCFTAGVYLHGVVNIIANNANFRISSGEFFSNANGTFECTNLLVHIDGGTGMRFNGSTEFDCNGVTFFASTGTLEWNGAESSTLIAPSTGDYANLLIYFPSTNSSALTINGNSDSTLQGSIIAGASPISILGNSTSVAGDPLELSSQIIGDTVNLGGNGNIVINYDPGQQFSLSEPHAISLTE
jgi:hypothetical protein